MPDISRITLPSGTTYNIKDAVARAQASGGIVLRGTTTTALTDGATTNPVSISGSDFTAANQDAVFYGNKEFVFDGTNWHEFGDMTGLGDLAEKDTASTSYTPAGSVSQPTFTGSSMTSTGDFTPVGTISASADASGNYTPAGSVAAPVISVATAGATTEITPITAVGTLPSLTATVSEETLTLSFDAGTLPTQGSAVNVKTGDAAYSASAPAFTGTSVQLDFTGTEGSVSVSGTTTGSVSAPTFSGTPATITVS